MQIPRPWLKSLFFLVVGAVLIAGPIHAQKYLIDYPMYERAANRILSGDVSNLHELDRKAPPKYHYSYFFALLFTVFALMGPALGHWILPAVYGLMFLYLLRFSVQRGAPPRLFYAVGLVGVLANIIAINDAFMTTNIGIVLAFLGALAYAVHGRYPVLAGTLVGAAIVIKIYPFVLLGYFIWQRNGKVILATLASVVFFYFLLPALIEGPTMAWTLIQTQIQVLSQFGDHWPMDTIVFQNIPATAMRYGKMLGMETTHLSSLSLGASAAAVIAFYWKGFWSPPGPLPEDLKYRIFALSMALIPMAVPTSWFNMGVFYLPLICHSFGLWLEKRDKYAGVGFAMYFVLYCLTANDLVGKAMNDRLEYVAVPFIGIVGMFLGYCASTLRAHPEFFPDLRTKGWRPREAG